MDTSSLTLSVELRPSAVHGRGVFVTRRVSRGDLLCFFDGEMRDARMRLSMARAADGTLTIKNAEEVFGTIVGTEKQVDKLAHFLLLAFSRFIIISLLIIV